MAKKDVLEYFDKVSDQYLEMQEALKDMEEEVQNNLISPDRIEQLKQTIEPIKTNYMRISYIVFLLNKPGFFGKLWNKLFGKKYKDCDLKHVENENKGIIDNLKL